MSRGWTESAAQREAEHQELRAWWESLGLKWPDSGVSIQRGWFPIITALVAELRSLGWDGTVYQVKQKFGYLRFWIGNHTDAMLAAIFRAEERTATTCEECGQPGRVSFRGSYRFVVCARCEELFKSGGQAERPFM